MEEKNLTYKDAGVDIDAGNAFVKMIKPLVKATSRPEVLADIGGFGGLFALGKYKNPVLVSGTDGVGTKLKLAFLADQHDTVGIDLVAMCVNDIVVQGAEPLFFLDYLATGRLNLSKHPSFIKGVAKGCMQAGCALIGGETAELPGFYSGDEYDAAGFAVGIVERDRIIDGSKILPGYKIIGLASSGLHSNGFSLARKVILEKMSLCIHDTIPGLGKTVAEELLTPTKIYVRLLLELIKIFHVAGIAHITGGGITENVPRILPNGCKAVINLNSWQRPEIFTIIQKAGNVDEAELRRTFNCGIGMVVVVPAEEAADMVQLLNSFGDRAYEIGAIAECEPGQESVEFTQTTSEKK